MSGRGDSRARDSRTNSKIKVLFVVIISRAIQGEWDKKWNSINYFFPFPLSPSNWKSFAEGGQKKGGGGPLQLSKSPFKKKGRRRQLFSLKFPPCFEIPFRFFFSFSLLPRRVLPFFFHFHIFPKKNKFRTLKSPFSDTKKRRKWPTWFSLFLGGLFGFYFLTGGWGG